METIFALTSARGRAGVAVVRISGPRARDALSGFGASVPPPRKAVLRHLLIGDQVLDSALVILFAQGASFTGEDTVELHLHGSPAITRAVLDHLSTLPDLRMADPGEFTRRALENGRMDLSQVEGLSALIDAETEAQRRQAQRVFAGALGALADGWRDALVRAAALLEVTIDFVDEDVPVDVVPEVSTLIGGVLGDLEREIAGSHISERIRDGFEVAIVGAPNAGKSTLLNALAGRDAALTSDVAGTTRDVIEVQMDLRGFPVTFLDTAGLRDTDDHVEGLGIRRAVDRAARADIRVFLTSNGSTPDIVEFQEGDINILGKGDLFPNSAAPSVSGATGQGIDALTRQIADRLEMRAARAATATHARHRAAMRRAQGALESALVEVKHGPDRVELAAEELRTALRALDALIGRVDVENLLDEIFSRFCLGK